MEDLQEDVKKGLFAAEIHGKLQLVDREEGIGSTVSSELREEKSLI